jgi:TonB family protein
MSFAPFAVDVAIKATLLAAAALATTAALRARSAAVRHWILAVAVICIAALPLVALVVPRWQIPLAATTVSPAAASSSSVALITIVTGRDTERTADRTEPSAGLRFAGLVTHLPVLLWLGGVAISGGVLAAGLLRLRAIAGAATRLNAGRWVDLVDEMARATGVRRPVVLLHSNDPTLLVTWGTARPKIVLPLAARDWDEERTRIVLRHELAHIQRGDWLVQVAAQVVLALNWFNPLVWIACRRLQRESEHACDDAVLRAGVDPADYASHLIALARTLTRRRAVLPAPAMARPSTLEGRIAAMLNARLNRSPLSFVARIVTAVLVIGLTVALAAVAAQHFSTFSGTLTDQTNAVLPNVAVVLTNKTSAAKYEVHSDPTGHFEFVGLPDGEYAMAANEPGFAPLKDAITIAGRDVERTVQLQLASLQETIRVTSGRSPSAPPSLDRRAEYRQHAQDQRREIMERCAASGGSGAIGGNIRQPTKVVDVKPRYPEGLSAAKVGGTIVLDAVIGTDGTVTDVSVVSGANPELDAAAIEAVRQWEFSTTFLNCTAVDVHMKVNVTFIAQP